MNVARTTTGRRVLFINPAKRDSFSVDRIHMGFTLMGQLLTEAGCAVLVLDYAFLRDLEGAVFVPTVEEAVAEFRPDVVGISAFTYLYQEALELVGRVNVCTDAPIVLGGPHVTIFPDDFAADSRISYLVRGEAEEVIVDLVRTASRQPAPVVVDCPLPSGDRIPAANLEIVHGSHLLRTFQIQLSRGCPFTCSFCNVELIAGGRRVRSRDLDACLEEIAAAVRDYPSIRTVTITDDCPNYDAQRFKRFLDRFAELKTGRTLTIDNVRADLLDEEMIRLYLGAGGNNLCLGTESAHPEVFRLINKGESLEHVAAVAPLVRKYGLQLGLCFVIGLPEDSLARHRESIALARRLKPDYVFWNMCIPWPGTDVHAWFSRHGRIGDVRGFSTLIDGEVGFTEPRAWSDDFTREERVTAWLMANMETYTFPVVPPGRFIRNLGRLWRLSGLYGIRRSFFIYALGAVPHQVGSALKKRWRRLKLRALGGQP